MPESDTVGARIRHYRKVRRFSQAELTAKAGVPGGYVADLERGAILSPRDPDNLRKIAVALRVPLRQLAEPTGWYDEPEADGRDEHWEDAIRRASPTDDVAEALIQTLRPHLEKKS